MFLFPDYKGNENYWIFDDWAGLRQRHWCKLGFFEERKREREGQWVLDSWVSLIVYFILNLLISPLVLIGSFSFSFSFIGSLYFSFSLFFGHVLSLPLFSYIFLNISLPLTSYSLNLNVFFSLLFSISLLFPQSLIFILSISHFVNSSRTYNFLILISLSLFSLI